MGAWEAFESILGRRPEPVLSPVPGLAMGRLPPHDDEFLASLDRIEAPDLDGVAIGIAYRDATGTPSVRTIRCRGAYRDPLDQRLVYIEAWCLHRRDWRTFRIDRIEEVYDYTTGELIGRPRPFFAPLLGVDLSEPLSEANARRLFSDGAKVLAYVAMSDGRLDDRELAVIVDFAAARVHAVSPAFHGPERAARLWIGNYLPSRQSALAGLRAVLGDDAYARDVAARMIGVMLADGHVTDAEMEAAWAIVKGMERAAQRAAK